MSDSESRSNSTGPISMPRRGRTWSGGVAMRKARLSPRGAVAIAGLLVVTALSSWVQYALVGGAGGEAVVVDTARYVEVAQSFQRFIHREAPLRGDYIRTPAFPLLLLTAAESSGVDLAATELPTQRWSHTNEVGRVLITRVLELQCALGALIPVLLYLLVLSVSQSPPLGLLAALCYLSDPATVSFQFVLATESLSVLFLFASLLAFALFLRSERWTAGLVAGLTVSAALLVKPTLAVLAVILTAAAILHFRQQIRLREVLPALGVFGAAILLGPLLWASLNWVSLGHFVFTKNAAWALQNFSARHFVELQIEDRELEVLQWHSQRTLDTPRERSWARPGHFVYTRSRDAVVEELAISDEYEFLQLIEAANRTVLLAHPLKFLAGGAERQLEIWTDAYLHPKNKEALRRLDHLPFVSRLPRQDGHLLLGVWTSLALLLLGGAATWMAPPIERSLLAAAIAFVFAYPMLTALFDEAEILRHAMQVRVLTNVLIVWALWVLSSRAALAILTATRRGHSAADSPQPGSE